MNETGPAIYSGITTNRSVVGSLQEEEMISGRIREKVLEPTEESKIFHRNMKESTLLDLGLD